jgi:hypothetical protein
LTVARQDDGQADQRLGLPVEGIGVPAVRVPLLKLVKEGRVVGHASLDRIIAAIVTPGLDMSAAGVPEPKAVRAIA